MKKFKLHLEDLQIDSFTTTCVKPEKGTVYGKQYTDPTACTCDVGASCYGTCDAGLTCDYYTCPGFVTFGLPGECILC